MRLRRRDRDRQRQSAPPEEFATSPAAADLSNGLGAVDVSEPDGDLWVHDEPPESTASSPIPGSDETEAFELAVVEAEMSETDFFEAEWLSDEVTSETGQGRDVTETNPEGESGDRSGGRESSPFDSESGELRPQHFVPTADADEGARLSPVSPGQAEGAGTTASAPDGPSHSRVEIPDVPALGASEPRSLPRVIAIANQKGGVGKTTTTVNLGAALSELSYRVLVIDLDPQGNATTGLGVDARNFDLSMYDVMMHDAPLEDCIEPTNLQNLFVVPATIDLAGVEIELVSAFSRELKLKRAVDAVVDEFDFVLIDCPPSLGLLTVNGLAAAREVLVPIQCEYYALEGLGQLLRNVHLVATNLNSELEVSTIVLTMFDARTRLAIDVAEEVRRHFTERVCRSVIPRTVRLSEAPSFGQPITVFDPTSRGAVAYRELAKEVSHGAPKRAG